MAHTWSHGTHGTLKYSLRRLVTFSEKYDVPTLLNTPLLHPPASPVIPILWIISHYPLQQSKRTKNNIPYNSTRALQSAAAAFNSWTLALAHPYTMYNSPNSCIPPYQSHIFSGGNPNQRRDAVPSWDGNPSSRRAHFKTYFIQLTNSGTASYWGPRFNGSMSICLCQLCRTFCVL
jgi:hypothetical protein